MNDDLKHLSELIAREHSELLQLTRVMIERNQTAMVRLTEAIVRGDEHSRVCRVCKAEKILAEVDPAPTPSESDVPF
jgi:hypothetical protein